MDDQSRRRILWIEVAVMTTFYFVPEIWSSSVNYFDPVWNPHRSGWLAGLSRIILELAIIVPALFIAWGSGDSWKKLGLRRFTWWQALPWILGSFLFYFFFSNVVREVFILYFPGEYGHSVAVYHRNATRTSAGAIAVSLRLISLVTGVFLEEFICRGYMITRLQELTGKFWVAAAVSSALFACYHIYEGTNMIPTAFGFGLVLAMAFKVTRSIWPGAIAHFLIDAFIVLRAIPW